MSNNEKGFQLVPIFQDIKKIKYHSRKWDVDFDILKKNSKYFNDHQDEYKNKKEIIFQKMKYQKIQLTFSFLFVKIKSLN